MLLRAAGIAGAAIKRCLPRRAAAHILTPTGGEASKLTQASIAGDARPKSAAKFGVRYGACIRAHAIDVISAALIFFSASLAAGRVWRFPFDDEIYQFNLSAAPSVLRLFPRNGGSEMFFYELQRLGLSPGEMRLCSLAMTAVALGLFQLLALALIRPQQGETHALSIRLIAILVFGLTPLAIGQGDALRWYPLFAFLIALFVALYLTGNAAAQLCSAFVFGLAGSAISVTAILIPPFMLYRYALQRRFRWSFDAAFWLIAGLSGAAGIYHTGWFFYYGLPAVRHIFGAPIGQAILANTLGFFGGDALGVSQAWIVAPTAVISAIAAYSAIDRNKPDNPVHLLLLMIGASALMTLAHLSEPRAFLYLAPMVAVLLILYFDRQIRAGRTARTLILVTLVLATSVSAIASVNLSTHPFKRNAVVPYQNILDFIAANERGRVLVVSTDPVLAWLLKNRGGDRCVGEFFAARRCLRPDLHYDSIFIVSGYGVRSRNAAFMQRFNEFLAEVTAGRRKAASLGAGIDDDAALKSRLTGVALDRTILTVDYYL